MTKSSRKSPAPDAADFFDRVYEVAKCIPPGRVTTYASPGSGSPMHILGELFNKSAGVKVTQVPYKGSGPAVVDMLGGHVPMMFDSLTTVLPHIRSGKIVALGVTSAQRSSQSMLRFIRRTIISSGHQLRYASLDLSLVSDNGGRSSTMTTFFTP